MALCYFYIFGEYQAPHSGYAPVIPKFIGLMRAGEPPTIYGDGLAARDFTHVANVADANIAAGTRRTPPD